MFSPGVVFRCFEVLRIAHENPLPVGRLRQDLPHDRHIDNGEVLKLLQEIGWLRVNDSGVAVLAPAGSRLLSLDSNSPSRLRRALLDYVEAIKPAWSKFALSGRIRTLQFAPSAIAQTISEAYLAQGYEEEVIEFWDRLAAIARGQNDIRLCEIGRMGERLTLGYERRRTGLEPKWRAIEDNSDGYDVLSVVSSEDSTYFHIEVKTSTIGLAGTLHLTRNEWESTLRMRYHAFHLWDLLHEDAPKLAIVSRAMMEGHIPKDQGAGIWKEVEISFAEFKDFFQPLS